MYISMVSCGNYKAYSQWSVVTTIQHIHNSKLWQLYSRFTMVSCGNYTAYSQQSVVATIQYIHNGQLHNVYFNG